MNGDRGTPHYACISPQHATFVSSPTTLPGTCTFFPPLPAARQQPNLMADTPSWWNHFCDNTSLTCG